MASTNPAADANAAPPATSLTRPAAAADLAWIAAPAVSLRVVDSAAELVAISSADPWRVRVTDRGEAMILGRWRDHLPDCAVLALWCDPRRIPVIVADLLSVAAEQGFEHLIGPLAPESEASRYREAGLQVTDRVRVMRLDRPVRAEQPGSPAGVKLRPARASDLPAILALDASCFDPFWRYDSARMEQLMAADRVAVATIEGTVVGYTLSTLRAGDGGLGRLAVAPAHRRRGIGRALALEAIGWAAGSGAHSVVLSTQEVNMASRGLYRSIGFRETGDMLVVCASGPLAASGASE